MPPAPKAHTPPHKGGQRPQAGWTLTLGGHGPTVDASPLAGHVAEGRGPAPEAVAVLVVVADPVAIALLPTAFRFKEGGVSALPLKANL